MSPTSGSYFLTLGMGQEDYLERRQRTCLLSYLKPTASFWCVISLEILSRKLNPTHRPSLTPPSSTVTIMLAYTEWNYPLSSRGLVNLRLSTLFSNYLMSLRLLFKIWENPSMPTRLANPTPSFPILLPLSSLVSTNEWAGFKGTSGLKNGLFSFTDVFSQCCC